MRSPRRRQEWLDLAPSLNTDLDSCTGPFGLGSRHRLGKAVRRPARPPRRRGLGCPRGPALRAATNNPLLPADRVNAHRVDDAVIYDELYLAHIAVASTN
jgi:hypothetical protein